MNEHTPFKSVAIICGGGPAPGINAVISSVAKIFLKSGYRVIGVHEGYKGIFSDSPQIKEFNFDHADRIFSRGGSTLIMSRNKPKDDQFNVKFFVDNNVKLLITIGGDDTASTANRLSKFLKQKGLDVSNIHVPKTIDNDLPLPDRNPTFGFHSAKDEAVKIGNTIYEDARTSQNWFVTSIMGRTAGHLAFGVATACHFPMMIIPEMFSHTKPTLDKIVNLIISSMVKRQLLGINYGAVVVSEGVFHILDEEELKNSGIQFTYDDHGHPELGNISKSTVINVLVQQRLKALNISIKSRPVEIGYELRCCRPIGFDLTLCTLLGLGVKKLYDNGLSSCIVSTNSNGDITPMFLKDLEDENGKIKPRLVDMTSEIARLCFQNLHYLTEADYDQVPNLKSPHEFDFHKILEWKV
jgi:ATP-dependent phosphofructokinase / diphosphate-dependent phosphofructokinase